MDFLRVISATCDDILEEVIDTELSNVKLVTTRFQEQLEDLLHNDSEFNIIIFKDTFPLNCHPLSFVKSIKETYPHIRIVFIITSSDTAEIDKYKTYLHSKQIYDIILDDDFGRDELISALFEPKSAQDILQEAKQTSFEDEFRNINEMEKMAQNNFENNNSHIEQENISINYNNNIKYHYPSPKVISFWSPKGGTGVDTLAINTALMLAKNTNIDVCLVDLSESPNMHLHFNMVDTRKNIETLYMQQATGKLNVYTIDNFVINGADTSLKIPNLYLIPGAVKRINFFQKMVKVDTEAFVGNCIEEIINVLREKYTIVILILSSNIYSLPTYAGLKKCNQINMVLENDVSSFYNANRYLHSEYGIFNAWKIDKSKCKLIINKFHTEDTFFIDNFIKVTGLPIHSFVGLFPDEAFKAYKTSSPLAFTQSNKAAEMGILSVVNTITSMEYTTPEDSNDKGKGGFINSIFKGKK